MIMKRAFSFMFVSASRLKHDRDCLSDGTIFLSQSTLQIIIPINLLLMS